MAKGKGGKKSETDKEREQLAQLERIKALAVAAMFSDDELMDELVLKGGNAMALIHKLTTRQSVDLDFSMQHDFPQGVEQVQRRIETALQRTYRPAGFEPFDFKMAEKPAQVSEDMAGFWGGYELEFKLATVAQFEALKDNLEGLRRSALSIGQGKKFLIDISRFEYVDGKQETELNGYRIYVYSPAMIACEKLRAICQQMEEYAPVIKRSRQPSQRARDFLDIHTLVTRLVLDLLEPRSIEMIRQMFALKRVELTWLGNIEKYRVFHQQGWPAVQDTVARDFDLQPFDYYFNYVVGLARQVLARCTPVAAAEN